MDKYVIRVGHPNANVTAKSPFWGYCRTIGAARKRAAQLGRKIRSDCRVGIEVGGVVIEQSGVAPFLLMFHSGLIS